MKVRSVANDGLLVYVDLYAEEPYEKVVELRFEHETDEHYTAQLWGNYLPLYFMYDETRNVDRVFIKLPYLESRMVLPIYLERTLVNRMVFNEPLFLLYDRGKMPQYVIGKSGDYHIDQEGFHLVNGVIALNYIGALPLKVKMMLADPSFSATFDLFDPINLLKKWTVDINNGVLSINGAQVTTLTQGLREIDFGIGNNKLALAFYENDELVYTVTNTTPLNEVADPDITIMQVSGQNVIVEDYMVLASAPEPVVIAGYQEYTDILELITSGQPKLNYPQRNGMSVTIGEKFTDTFTSIRKVASAQDFQVNGNKIVVGEYHVSDSPVELVITEDVDGRFGCELIVTQDITDDFGAELKLVTIVEEANAGIKITIPSLDIWYYGILNELREWFENSYPTIRSIQGFDEAYQGIRVTVTMQDSEEVAKYGVFMDIEKFKETIVDYLVVAMKKYYGFVKVVPAQESGVSIIADYYTVEVNAYEE